MRTGAERDIIISGTGKQEGVIVHVLVTYSFKAAVHTWRCSSLAVDFRFFLDFNSIPGQDHREDCSLSFEEFERHTSQYFAKPSVSDSDQVCSHSLPIHPGAPTTNS